MPAQVKSTPWASLFFALLGLIWCGYVAFPTANPAPCSTSGCALFRDFTFSGISLWWVGGAYFFLLAVLCLRGHRSLARFMAMLALFADAVLLLVMFLTAPCVQCLIVAALMGLCYYTLRKPAPDGWFAGVETAPSLLLPIWFGLLLGNAALAMNEQLPLYALGNTRSSEAELRPRIFFSPSCGACREALSHFGNAAILYPVMEKEQDFDAIVRFAALLKANVPVHEAVSRSIDPDAPVPALALHERSLLSVQLFRNKAALMRQGFRGLPLVQINAWQGARPTPLESSTKEPAPWPQGAAHEYAPSSAPPSDETPGPEEPDYTQPAPVEQLPDFLSDPGALTQCGGENAKPCE